MADQREFFDNGLGVTAPRALPGPAQNSETTVSLLRQEPEPSQNANRHREPSETSNTKGIGVSKNVHCTERVAPSAADLRLHASLHSSDRYLVLNWLRPGNNRPISSIVVQVEDEDCLKWTARRSRKDRTSLSRATEAIIRERLTALLNAHPLTNRNFEAVEVRRLPISYYKPESRVLSPLRDGQSPIEWLTGQIRRIVHEFRRSAGRDFIFGVTRTEERRAAEAARLKQNQEAARLQQLARLAKRASQADKAQAQQPSPAQIPQQPKALEALPPVPVRIEPVDSPIQESALPLTSLSRFGLQEKAALWWISNQTDNLLCLPFCRIERLEYQVRTALRVLGPLRGRALLSDEVGLGKTVEAGLVLKELLIRGMVKRFLVLTVPSLVDQWQEELEDKFGLAVATTNNTHAGAATDDFGATIPRLLPASTLSNSPLNSRLPGK